MKHAYVSRTVAAVCIILSGALLAAPIGVTVYNVFAGASLSISQALAGGSK